MKKLYFIALLFICLASNARTVNLKIVETSDVHGAFFPNMGKVYAYVEEQRKVYGDNLLLLDAGDILQGEPCSYFYNFVNIDEENVAAKVVNYMRYDAQTFGNHDVETGHAVYDKWGKEVKCPTLGANIIEKNTGKPYAIPYYIYKRKGVKVAVLGMLTPAIPNWLSEKLWSGLEFEDIKASCKKWIEIIKKKEKPDVIIGLFHSGLKGGITTDTYCENEAEQVAREVPGFDAIMFGHDHQKYCQKITNIEGNDVWMLNPANKAHRVAELTVSIEGKKKTLQGSLHETDSYEPSAEYMAYFADDIKKIDNYMEEPIGVFDDDMATHDAFFGNSKYIDFIHKF
ncbi:MAG: metallophosphoesterase, partial [Prevotellaceae bacterium]|nr:metallophosphoesterase [Prevotellaceae bacterium]